MKSVLIHAVLLLILVIPWGCGDETVGPEGLDSLVVYTWGPGTVVVGTRVEFEGQGFIPPQLGEMSVRMDGTAGTAAVVHDGILDYVDDNTAHWVVPADFAAAVSSQNQPFVGSVKLTRKVYGYAARVSVKLSVTMNVQVNLTPTLQTIAPDGAYIGDELQVHGQGMLTSPEGTTMLFLSGQYHVASPPMVKDVLNVAIPLDVENRERAVFQLSPDKFGVYPGYFVGAGHLTNFVSNDATAPAQSQTVEGLGIHVYRSAIEEFSPDLVRRGQVVQVTGRGFVETDPVGETATLVLLEGVFDTTSGKQISFQGKDSMLLFPETFQGSKFMEVILRVAPGVDGELTGLGLIPGVFTGTAYPELFYGGESYRGDGLDFVLTVAPQLQVVFVKFLPSFDESLHDFGMHAVKENVKARIIERCNRDYAAYNVTFSDQRPLDFVEYSIIELSGEDPNGANLLGLDSTTGKDINNLRFNDIVGGKNAETEEQGYYAYGGVFLNSFLMFSPTISQGKTSLASSRFEDIFAAFMPELGGVAIAGGEYPGGGRDALIQEAIRVLGNLVGGTVAHEVGHTLGLAMVPGHPEEFHNLGDNPGWLMDAGNYRPFEERSDLDGMGPEIFSPYNHDYMMKILPKG